MMDTNNTIYSHHHLAKRAGIFLLTTVPLAYGHNGHDIVFYLKLLATQIGTLLMTVAWLKGTLHGHIKHQRSPLDIPVLLFLLLTIISWATIAINPLKSGVEVVKVFTFVALYFALSRTFHLSFLKPWIYVVTLVTAFVSIIGICQYLGIAFLWLRSSGYPSATFVYRNFAAMYLIMAIPLTLLPFILARHFHTALLWGLLSACPIIFLIYTRTRGAWLGILGSVILVGLGCYFFYKCSLPKVNTAFTKQKYILSIFIITLIFIAAQTPPNIPDATYTPNNIPTTKTDITTTLQSIVKQQDSGRSIIWKHAVELIRDHWLIGVGIGNWELIYPIYDRGDTLSPGFIVQRPHNDLIWIWAELGIFGLITFFYIIAITTLLFVKSFQNPPLSIPYFVPLIAISLLAIAGHAQFSFPKERIPPLLFCCIITSIVSHLCSQQKVMPNKSKLLYLPIVLSILCIALSSIHTFRATQADRWHYTLTRHRLRNDWKNVIYAANQALQWGVFDHWILFWKAHALHRTGDVPQALKIYQTSLQYRPHEMTTYWKIGLLEQSLGNFKQAQTALERAVFLDADNPDFHQDLGIVYHLQGQLKNAHNAYLKALSFNAKNPQIYINIGNIYETWNQQEDAIKIYKQYLEQEQKDIATTDLIQKRLQKLQTLGPLK